MEIGVLIAVSCWGGGEETSEQLLQDIGDHFVDDLQQSELHVVLSPQKCNGWNRIHL